MVVKTKEKIAANVVTYNRKELLLECLEALIKQTHRLDAIYIIDNASTDKTPELLKEKKYIDRIINAKEKPVEIVKRKKGIEIHYIRMPENTGSAGGQYEGIKRAYEKGFDWIWVMDDDSIPEKECLKKLFISSINADIVTPLKITVNQTIQFEHFGTINKHFLVLKKINELPNAKRTKIDFSSFIGPMFKRSIISKVGFPKKEFFIWEDDFEYFLRFVRHDAKIYLIKDAIILHKDQQIAKGITFSWKNYYGWRNKIYIKKKYLNFFSFLVFSFLFSIYITIKIVIKSSKKIKYLKLYKKSFNNAIKKDLTNPKLPKDVF